MSASLNKVMMIGRVVSEVEPVRTIPGSGHTTTRFRLAVGRGKKNPQTGQWENSDTMFIDCEVFAYADAKRNLVDIVTKYVKKGDSVYLEGRLKLDEWQSPDGQKRSKHKIDVTDFQFLGSKQDDGGEGDEGGQEQQAPPPRQSRPPARSTANSDIPF